MENLITEVQGMCILLMGLLSLILIFSLPRHLKSNEIFNKARKFLTCGTILVTIHFTVQYILHKSITDVATIRTVNNLIFGFPISYCFCMSMFYLHRRGRLKRWMWLTVPSIALSAYIIAAVVCFTNPEAIKSAIIAMAVLYACELIFNASILVSSYIHIIRLNRYSADDSYILLIKWTKWSTFIMVGIGLGFPIMTFNPNLLMRSIYGILSISAGFFYVVSFIGYGFSKKEPSDKDVPEEVLLSEINNSEGNEVVRLSEKKQKKMEEAIKVFEKERLYLQPEVTMKDIADQLGISLNMLRIWLRNSEYEKFNNWITIYRIAYAKHLFLNNSDISSETVAEKCGFCDRQYFQKTFTKHVGITPSRWIKENLKDTAQ